MAGRPAKRQKELMEVLERKGTAAGTTPVEWVHDFIANGNTLTQLADELEMSRAWISRRLNAMPEFREALNNARKEGAEAQADDTLHLTDEIARRIDAGEEVSSERVTVLREQVKARQWLASMNNPERFAKNGPTININLGDLHLDALRQSRIEMSAKDVTPDE